MSASQAKKIVLAGRAFVPVGESTIEHDSEVVRLLKAAGLHAERQADGEGAEGFALRILQQLIEVRSLFPLIGCLILPAELARARAGGLRGFLEDLVGLDHRRHAAGWTPEVQDETARFVAALYEPKDKARVYQLVAELLVPFLSAGLTCWLPSGASSITAASDHEPEMSSSEVATSVRGEG